MDRYVLDLSKVKDDMLSYVLIYKIYEFNDKFIQENEIEFNKLTTNQNIINHIDSINFVRSKESSNPDQVYKIGLLRNFLVYLDTKLEEDVITLSNNEESVELEILFE